MDKIAKFFGILDLFLIVVYTFTKINSVLSSEIDSFFLGLIIGLAFFVLFVSVFIFIKNLLIKRKSKKKKLNYEATNLIYLIGAVLSFIVIILVFNSSLYFQALLGKDLFLSLTLDKDSFLINNGENLSLTAEFGIVTNPFCFANCNVSVKDLSSGDILFFEETPISVSSSVSRNYKILVNETYSGQKLYLVDLTCESEKKVFCYTSTNNSKHSNKIISVEHSLNQEQNQSLTELKAKIESLSNNYSQIISDLEVINSTISKNYSLDLSKFTVAINNLSSSVKERNLILIVGLFNAQNFSALQESLQLEDSKLIELSNNFSSIKDSLIMEINSSNELFGTLHSIRNYTLGVSSTDLDTSSVTSLNSFIDNFNLAVSLLNISKNLTEKNETIEQLISEKNNLTLTNLLNESLRTSRILSEINSSYIVLNFNKVNSSLKLENPSPICCLLNRCDVCLNESYANTNYPIILLHGHSFNEQVSALASLEVFNSLQASLEKDGYVNAGSLLYLNYENGSKDIFGKVNNSVSIKASYYFDILSADKGYSLLETKTDNIDTYTIRLKDIIDNVKYITGKDKVIIVAHSMGGLVARRYVQVFGENSVDKLVLVAVPNHGVDGFVVNYCSVFGTKTECGDMNSNSLFLNKLNRGSNPSIPVYNIIGEGCTWENSIGDGIAKNESAYLSFATNYYINGTCNGFDYFHNNILETESYPEVYNLIKQILNK